MLFSTLTNTNNNAGARAHARTQTHAHTQTQTRIRAQHTRTYTHSQKRSKKENKSIEYFHQQQQAALQEQPTAWRARRWCSRRTYRHAAFTLQLRGRHSALNTRHQPPGGPVCDTRAHQCRADKRTAAEHSASCQNRQYMQQHTSQAHEHTRRRTHKRTNTYTQH